MACNNSKFLFENFENTFLKDKIENNGGKLVSKIEDADYLIVINYKRSYLQLKAKLEGIEIFDFDEFQNIFFEKDKKHDKYFRQEMMKYYQDD